MRSFFIKLGKIARLWKRSGFWGGLKIIWGYLCAYFKAFFVGSGEVLFVSSGVGDSALYRAYNPAEELRLHGINAKTTISDNPRLEKLADRFSVFVLHRTLWNKNVEGLVRRAKELKKEIIFDTDDLVYDGKYISQMDYFEKMSPAEKAVYEKGIGAEIVDDLYVKVATTTVTYLAKKLREKGKRVIIVPNRISNAEFSLAEELIERKKTDDGIIRIAYASGTLSHNKDFATIGEALLTILEKYENVKLRLMGPLDISPELEAVRDRIEIIPRVPRKEMYEKLYEADINLAPLEIGNPFCESKSAIKFTEAGVLKLPTVAVRNQTFSETIEDGVDGFLAADTGEWIEKLSRLIEDENFRKTMGEKAREKVLKYYTNRNSQNEEYYRFIRGRIKNNKE